MCSIDWPLVLKYVQAVAVPVATVLSVFLVSWLGLRAFREQRALERRLAWYERAYTLLVKTDDLYSQLARRLGAASKDQATFDAWFKEASKDGDALREHLGASWLYADDDAHEAADTFQNDMAKANRAIAQAQRILPEEIRRIQVACAVTSLRLSMGIRRQLGLAQLKPVPERASK